MQFLKLINRKRIFVFIFLLTLVLTILSQANPSAVIPNRDSGSFLHIGRVILNGGMPYRDAWDSKPPAIFYIDALGIWLGQDTRWGVWLIEFFFLFCSACLGYSFLKRLWGEGAAILGSFFWLWGLNQVLITGNLIEEYPLLFNFLALFLFIGSYHQKTSPWYFDILIGITAGMSFMFRANNMGVQISIVLALIIWAVISKNLMPVIKRICLIALGAAIPLAIVLIYFSINGILNAMIEAAILYNFYYIGGTKTFFSNVVAGFTYLNLSAWAALVSYFTFIILLFLKNKNKPIDLLSILFLLSWPVEMFLSSVAGRNSEHYFVCWLPAICLTSGHIFSPVSQWLAEKNESFQKQWQPWVLLLLSILFIVLNWNNVFTYWKSVKMLLDRQHGIELINPVSKYIRNNTQPTDRVLVWGGQSGINYLSKRNSSTAYLWYPLYQDSPYTPAMIDGFYQDLVNDPPELVIDACIDAPEDVPSLDSEYRSTRQYFDELKTSHFPPNLNQVMQYIHDHYHLEETKEEYRIYRLNGH